MLEKDRFLCYNIFTIERNEAVKTDVIKLSLPDRDRTAGVGFLRQFSVAETYPMHSHLDFFEIFFVLNGKAIHCINGENQLLQKGSLVLIRPDDIHSYKAFNRHDFELVSIGFLVPIFNSVCEYMGLPPKVFTDEKLPPHIVLDGYDFSDISRKLLRMEKRTAPEERRLYFKGILPFILHRLLSYGNDIQMKSIPNRIRELIDAMSEKENFIEGLPRLTELSGTTQEHLTREFRKYLDMTPTEFINLRRLSYAAELLLECKYDIIDICFMCGFGNLSHFYHIFKKTYGCSPKQFVKNHTDN